MGSDHQSETDARCLRRDRLADFGVDEIERGQKQRRESQELTNQRLKLPNIALVEVQIAENTFASDPAIPE